MFSWISLGIGKNQKKNFETLYCEIRDESINFENGQVDHRIFPPPSVKKLRNFLHKSLYNYDWFHQKIYYIGSIKRKLRPYGSQYGKTRKILKIIIENVLRLGKIR